MRFQLAESRSKCELLEQSLRVIAQENFELETGKMRSSDPKAKTATPSELSAKNSVDDENVIEATMNMSIADTDQVDEFFDTADDPLTDDDNGTENENYDGESLALRSCYGSIDELTASIIEKVDTKSNEISIIDSKKSPIKEENLIKVIETDELGWR